MEIQVYDSENYNSWEDAEKNGAVYTREIVDSDTVKNIIRETIEITETCIRNDNNINWRVIEK